MKAILGIKKGMTRVFKDEKMIPVTIIDTSLCKIATREGNQVELGLLKKRNPIKAEIGRYKELKYAGNTYDQKYEINEILIDNDLNWFLDAEVENIRLEILNNTLIINAGIIFIFIILIIAFNDFLIILCTNVITIFFIVILKFIYIFKINHLNKLIGYIKISNPWLC